MAIFPKIQSPCPYKGDLSAIMDGDVCRLCKREVYDISALSDAERVAFISSCADEVCVTYKFPMRAAVAMAMSVVALGVPMAAAAQDFEGEAIIVGGITDTANVQYVSDAHDNAVPELPVVYDDQQKPAAQADASNTQTPTASEGSAASAGPDLSETVKTQ